MNVCYICHKPLNKGDVMCVLSFPVVCTEDGGDYSIFSDFSKNEKIAHIGCFQYKPAAAKSQLPQEFKNCLLELGEDLTDYKVHQFMSKYGCLQNLDDLLKKWFEDRESAV